MNPPDVWELAADLPLADATDRVWRDWPDVTAEQAERDRLDDKAPADSHWWGRDL